MEEELSVVEEGARTAVVGPQAAGTRALDHAVDELEAGAAAAAAGEEGGGAAAEAAAAQRDPRPMAEQQARGRAVAQHAARGDGRRAVAGDERVDGVQRRVACNGGVARGGSGGGGVLVLELGRSAAAVVASARLGRVRGPLAAERAAGQVGVGAVAQSYSALSDYLLTCKFGPKSVRSI